MRPHMNEIILTCMLMVPLLYGISFDPPCNWWVRKGCHVAAILAYMWLFILVSVSGQEALS